MSLENEELRLRIRGLTESMAELAADLTNARSDLASFEDQLEHALAQRDEAVDWGKRLHSFGGAILATDAPDWVA